MYVFFCCFLGGWVFLWFMPVYLHKLLFECLKQLYFKFKYPQLTCSFVQANSSNKILYKFFKNKRNTSLSMSIIKLVLYMLGTKVNWYIGKLLDKAFNVKKKTEPV